MEQIEKLQKEVEGNIENEWRDTEMKKKNFRRQIKFTLAPKQSVKK